MTTEIYEDIKNLLAEKTIWAITENGWYYTKALNIFFDEESAIACWEELTKVKYSKEKYEEITTNYDSNYQGFYYYGIEKSCLKDIFKELDCCLINKTIYEESKKIYKKGNDLIKNEGYKESEKRTNEILNGMLFYLEKSGVWKNMYNREKQESAFWEYANKMKK